MFLLANNLYRPIWLVLTLMSVEPALSLAVGAEKPPPPRRVLYNFDGDSCLSTKAGSKGPVAVNVADVKRLIEEVAHRVQEELGLAARVKLVMDVCAWERRKTAHDLAAQFRRDVAGGGAGLEDAGARFAFGIPGTHNIELYDALDRSAAVTAVLVTDEQSAGFMADGVSRSSGSVATVLGNGSGLPNLRIKTPISFCPITVASNLTTLRKPEAFIKRTRYVRKK